MPSASARDVARLLVDIGALLQRSGAHTERTVRNLTRFANAFGFQPDIFISFSGITLTVHGEEQSFTMFSHVPAHGVHLSTVAEVSMLSWRAEVEGLSLAQIRKELDPIRELPHYPRLAIVLMIGLGCAALSRLAGAELSVTALTGAATAVALLVRMKLTEWKLNIFLTVCASAMAATVTGSLAGPLGLGETGRLAIAASVLFLIPGVPLINAVIDMINGHMSIGMARGMMGMAIAFALSVGMLVGMNMMGVAGL